ncbi:hypothetical protein MYCTH_2058054, partial [Thermothelomyces thermophilus ATCC 42464]
RVRGKKTYNTGDSPVVTDLSTSPAVSSLSKGERTGSRILYCLWSYVLAIKGSEVYKRPISPSNSSHF